MNFNFKHIQHFRELGGYKTIDNRTIKHNVFFRSGELSRIDDDEIEALNYLHIDTVFDLRTIAEQKNAPDKVGAYKVISCSMLKESKKIPKDKKNNLSHNELLLKYGEAYNNYSYHNCCKDYILFSSRVISIKKILKSLKNHETILFHCYGGKDRTGFIAILIMALLGCSYDICKENYMLHNILYDDEVNNFLDNVLDIPKEPLVYNSHKFLMRVSDEQFDCIWFSIFSVYKTIEDYLYDNFKLTLEEIEDIRNFYLE